MGPDHSIKDITIPGLDDRAAPRSPCEDLRALLRDLTVSRTFFRPLDDSEGPFCLELSVVENRLAIMASDCHGNELPGLYLSCSPYRKLISDYYILCDSYMEARRSAGPSRLEAIDMGRRALHNEGAALLMERLAHRIEMDLPTARRLFTIMCALHGKH